MAKGIKDSAQVIIANGGAVGMSMTECNQWLTAISLSLAIIYTCWKFYKNIKND
jgi:predicted benzoate:H+ symporter BenE|tara:strand:+ start:3247 stop:3408 length:162 start_codon:yes stop_codon:yes gene_type:complete